MNTKTDKNFHGHSLPLLVYFSNLQRWTEIFHRSNVNMASYMAEARYKRFVHLHKHIGEQTCIQFRFRWTHRQATQGSHSHKKHKKRTTCLQGWPNGSMSYLTTKFNLNSKHCSVVIQTHMHGIWDTTGSNLKPNGKISEFFLHQENTSIRL
jgi:hypothetical protein